MWLRCNREENRKQEDEERLWRIVLIEICFALANYRQIHPLRAGPIGCLEFHSRVLEPLGK